MKICGAIFARVMAEGMVTRGGGVTRISPSSIAGEAHA